MKDKLHKGNFKIPEGYFEGFPGRLEYGRKLYLSKIEKDSDGFRVPKGYFNNFETRLQRRLSPDSKSPIPIWRQPKFLWTTAVAASLVLLLFLRPQNQINRLTFEDLARTEIEDYLESRYAEMSTFELAESLPFSEVNYGDVMENMPQENHILNYLEHKTEAYDHYNFENDE